MSKQPTIMTTPNQKTKLEHDNHDRRIKGGSYYIPLKNSINLVLY
jgi:hypothetical protein